MAGELYSYLNTATADYTSTRLAVLPWQVMPVTGGFNQTRIEYDDDAVQVINHASGPRLFAGLRFRHLSDVDAGAIFDLYMDPAKGFGQARTFEWESPNVWPAMGFVYVVRFASPTIEALVQRIREFSELRMQIHGYTSPGVTLQGDDVALGGMAVKW